MRNNAQLLMLDAHAAESLLTIDSVLAATARAFELHRLREARMFPVIRESLNTGGVFGIKAGDMQSESLLGFKAAGFWPSNHALGGESHQATVILIDPASGRPKCIIDGNAITTMRTGAAGGLGLRALARPDSQRLCVFGKGVQARIQVTFALHLMPGIESVRYLTSDRMADARFESYFRGQCKIAHASDADEAVAASDIVITATPGRGPLFNADAVQPGTHINCVGADTKGKRELPEGLLDRARLFVDDRIQTAQIGETQWQPAADCTELGEVLADPSKLTRRREDITVFDMTGLALQDLTVAQMMQERALEQDIGTRIAWPW